jgi:hypothetical protein
MRWTEVAEGGRKAITTHMSSGVVIANNIEYKLTSAFVSAMAELGFSPNLPLNDHPGWEYERHAFAERFEDFYRLSIDFKHKDLWKGYTLTLKTEIEYPHDYRGVTILNASAYFEKADNKEDFYSFETRSEEVGSFSRLLDILMEECREVYKLL